MRRVSILGSTGSIGRQALEVVAAHPERFAVAGLAGKSNVALLAAQANTFRPLRISAGDAERALALRRLLDYEPEVVGHGAEGLRLVATDPRTGVLLAATDGMDALEAVLGAVCLGLTVALSNKELAVAAGELLFAEAKNSGSKILPVDSEHSAVLQCIAGEDQSSVARVILTASGGPFWETSLDEMATVSAEQALRHPTWSMGRKNSLDSATLMNKGLEVIEASRFFALQPSQIEVVVHPQSIVHAFVEFVDGSIKAQLARPDMRLPIGYALSYPERLDAAQAPSGEAIPGLCGPGALRFEPVDNLRFPSLRLAYTALQRGGTYPAVLSAANEEAGRAFLQGKVRFTDIAQLTQRALDAHEGRAATLDAIKSADRWARSSVLSTLVSKT